MNTTNNIAFSLFLGNAPRWYKWLIICCLIINPLCFFWVDPFIAGWLLIIEFILTLAMSLKCYPLQPGGLLTIEAIIIGMTSPSHIKAEILSNFEVILLLIFMVAGIYFMKQLLLYVFTKLLVNIRSKILLSFSFCISATLLSAFLDALTVIAVIITVSMGFYGVYHKVASGNHFEDSTDITTDKYIFQNNKQESLSQFRAFLCSLLMHAGIGSTLGGVMTMVGEPQNLIIAERAGWSFGEFFLRVLPISLPVFISGLLTCILLEKFKWFGYGVTLPEDVANVLVEYNKMKEDKMRSKDRLSLIIQSIVGIWLIMGLAFHIAEVGLIGLSVIILCTAFCGITDEHQLGKSFQEALPFTALLIVFFSVVAVIVDLKLFEPIIQLVLSADPKSQLSLFYIFNGILSSISDNVFVGTIYINEAKNALALGVINEPQFNLIAIAINVGTNLPSVATPNGQAAFLFLLTSSIAPLIKLSYGKMVYMALPYTIVLSCIGYISLEYLLPTTISLMNNLGWLVN